MSGKISKWKELNSTGDRLNKMLNTKPNDLPTRFAPKRDRSESVDKLFNNSRSRVHSSFELTALNKTREQQFLELKKTTTLQTERKEELQKKASTLLPNLNLAERQSTQLFQSQYPPTRPSLLIAEIKKQYLSFKKNVLAELERQRQMVQKMLKEIVLTFQYELEKMTRLERVISSPAKDQQANDLPKVKTIEEWKSNLASVSIAEVATNHRVPEVKQQADLKQQAEGNKREKSRPSRQKPNQKRDEIQPPKPMANLDAFLGNLATLKKQLNQMDKILDRPEQAVLQKQQKK